MIHIMRTIIFYIKENMIYIHFRLFISWAAFFLKITGISSCGFMSIDSPILNFHSTIYRRINDTGFMKAFLSQDAAITVSAGLAVCPGIIATMG